MLKKIVAPGLILLLPAMVVTASYFLHMHATSSSELTVYRLSIRNKFIR